MEFLEEFGGYRMTSISPQHSPPLIDFCLGFFIWFVWLFVCVFPSYQIWDWAKSEASTWWRTECGQKGVQAGASRRCCGCNSEAKTWKALHWRTAKNDAMHQVHAKILTLAKTREHMYIPLEWIEDIINAIAYYSILRNATAYMHKKCF